MARNSPGFGKAHRLQMWLSLRHMRERRWWRNRPGPKAVTAESGVCCLPSRPQTSGVFPQPRLFRIPRKGQGLMAMRRAKISVIGAGNIGGECARSLAMKELGDVVLVDIPNKDKPELHMPRGKALDLACCGPVESFDARITGTFDYADIEGSDVVVVTAGLPRKPGMSRDDLVQVNTGIVKHVSENIK